MNKINLYSSKLTTALVVTITVLLFLLYQVAMQSENDYVYYTHYFFYFGAILFFTTWYICKGTGKRRAWLIFGILTLIIAVLIHMASLYVVALGNAFQH